LPRAARAAGISFPRLCCELIEIALREKDREQGIGDRGQKISDVCHLPSDGG